LHDTLKLKERLHDVEGAPLTPTSKLESADLTD